MPIDPPHRNLVQLLENAVARFGDNELFGTRDHEGEYHWVTYREVGQRVERLRAGLARAGLGPGDSVGIIANNCVDWAVVAFAAYGRRARLVPMYEAELEATWRYIVQDSAVKLLFVSNQEIADQLSDLPDAAPVLERLVLMEGRGSGSMAALEAEGQQEPCQALQPEPEDIAALIYTSGTTSKPKGVLLSHGNFVSNAWAGLRRFPELDENGRSLSILPWAHSYGQTAELYVFLQFGGSVGFMGSVQTLKEDFLKVRPTYLLAVPRIFNRIYDGILDQFAERGGVARWLFETGVAAAQRRRDLAEQGRWELLTSARFHVVDRVVFEKIRQRFGGRLLGALTGSATMNPQVSWFFHDIGIPVFDCYGLTETSPAVTMNSSTGFKPGTVGQPIDHVRVEIDRSVCEEGADDGEVVVYGPNVMQGYHNQPEATAAVITEDGGFRTGDRGRLDEEGYLTITGRIKEQYKLENGKYVFPVALEEEIGRVAGVANAVIFGAGRSYNICLLVPDLPAIGRLGEELGMEGSPEQLLLRPQLLEALGERIQQALRGDFGGYEIPKRFAFIHEELSLEGGTLTQTMKLKRRVVYERYAAEIEGCYAK